MKGNRHYLQGFQAVMNNLLFTLSHASYNRRRESFVSAIPAFATSQNQNHTITQNQQNMQTLTNNTAINRNWASRFLVAFSLVVALLLSGISSLQAQTTLVSPTAEGGFELGATPTDNGWTVVGSGQSWYVGGSTITAPSAGSGMAYTSTTAGSAWGTGTIAATSVTHMYRDITMPASTGAMVLNMSLKYKISGPVDATFDYLQAWVVPTTFTPTGGSLIVSTTSGGTQMGANQDGSTSYTIYNFGANVVPGSTYRLVLSFRSDAFSPYNSAAVDEINVTTSSPSTFTAKSTGGLWSNKDTWVGGVVPVPGNDILIPAGSVVAIDGAITSFNNVTVNGTLQGSSGASASANSLTINGDLVINAGGSYKAFTTGGFAVATSIGGNLVNDGYANFVIAGLRLNGGITQGNSSVISGSGVFEGTSTEGIFSTITVANTGTANAITTTQNLLVNTGINLLAGSINTNGKLRYDNTVGFHGRPLNTQMWIANVSTMGAGYTTAPFISGSSASPWISGTALSSSSRYWYGNNLYLCTAAVTATANTTAPTHTSGNTGSLLWIGTNGTLGAAYLGGTNHTLGNQYVYGDNLYLCTLAGNGSTTTGPTGTSTTEQTVGVAKFVYVGAAPKVSANFDAATGTIRSLNIVNAGSGLSGSPTVNFSGGGTGGTGSPTTAAVAAAVVYSSASGAAFGYSQKSGQANITGGFPINSDQNVGVLSEAVGIPRKFASSGVGYVALTGGANYTVAPQMGFSGPTALNLVTNGGSGYTSAPTITVSGGTQPVGATALASTDFTITVANGKVVSVYLNTSVTKTYITPPTLAFSGGGGSGATLAFPTGCWPAATCNIGSNRQILSVTVTNSGFGYVTAPTAAVGNASGTVTGGTYSTAVGAPTVRIGAFQLVTNYFGPATASVVQADDAIIPSSRKLHCLWLSGNGNGFNLASELTLISAGTGSSLSTTTAPAPIILASSLATPGNIFDLGGNNLNFSWYGYAGTTTVGAANLVKNGSITLLSPGGSQTRNFPFLSYPTVATGTGSLATGSDITSITATELGAPTNSTVGGNAIAIGKKAYKVQTNGIAGTAPTVTIRYDANDSLTNSISLQNQAWVAEGPTLNGAWNLRSDSIGGGTALAASGSKSTLTTTTTRSGPIALTSGNIYAWATPAPTITSVSPLSVCAFSGQITINGTDLNGVSAVFINGVPVTSFTLVANNQINAIAGATTTGVVTVVKSGITAAGTQTVVVNNGPSAPVVTPSAASVVMGQTATLSAAPGTGSGTIFNWYTTATGGSAVSSDNPYTTPVNCNSNVVYVAESDGTCEGPRTAVVLTVTRPTINFSKSTFCGIGGADTLTVSPYDPSINYTWTALNSGGTFTGATTGQSVVALVTATAEFKVSAVSGSCTDSAFGSVGLYSLPSATVTTTASGVCPGTAATIGSGLVAGNFTAACITPAPKTIPANATRLVNNGTATVTQTSGGLDDGGWGNIPLGFTFNFFGTSYTNVNVGTNGVLQFGAYNSTALGDFTIGALPNTSDPKAAIFLASHDWDAAYSTDYIAYWTEGYAPNRRFVIEYNVHRYVASGTVASNTQINNMQAIIYETLGTIDIIAKSNTSLGTKTIGVNSPTGTVGAAAPNCSVTPNTANYWQAQAATISAASPQAWRFAPPDNYNVLWFANGTQFASGLNLFSQSVAPTVTTEYSITYTNQTTGCTNEPRSAVVNMEVLSATTPTGVNTTSSVDSTCVGSTFIVQTDYTGNISGMTFQWQKSTDGGANWNDITGATSSSYAAVQSVVTSYRCTLVQCGASPEYTSPKTVYFSNAITSVTSATRCGLGTATLSATSLALPDSIRWYAAATGGTSLGTGATFTTPAISTTTIYWAEPRNPSCPGVRVPDTVFVNAPPALTIDSASFAICAGATSSLVSLTAGGSDYDQLSWSPSTGVSGNANDGWLFNPTTTTTFTLNGAQSQGICLNKVIITVTVNQLPVMDSIVASANNQCAGTAITLNGYSSKTGSATLPTGYCAGLSSTTYGDEQIFAVNIGSLVNNQTTENCSGNYTDYTSTISPLTLFSGQTYTGSVVTDECDGSTYFSSGLSVYIDYNRDGTFQNSERVYTTNGTLISPNTRNISFAVPSGIQPGLTRMRIVVLEGDNKPAACNTSGYGEAEDYAVNLVVKQRADVTYNWTPGNLTGASVTVNPVTTTTYSVSATDNATGCVSASPATVTINTLALPASPEGSGSTQCGSGIPTCFVTGAANGNYRWYTTASGGTAIAGENNNTLSAYIINTTTTFYVSITDGTCESVRTPVLASVTQPNAITASANNSSICLNGTVNLSVAQTGTENTYTYGWYASPFTGSGLSTSESSTSFTVTPTAAGTYVYTVTGIDASQGCVISSSVSVLVKALPLIDSVKANPTAVCSGLSSTLSAFSTGLGEGSQTLPTGYPASRATSTADEDIFNVSIGTLNNTSDCGSVGPDANSLNRQYANYTLSVAAPQFTVGDSATISVQVGTCGTSPYNNKVAVYIDWNRDGVLNSDDSVYTTPTATSGPNTVTKKFMIPMNAKAGLTLMRVIANETTGAVSPSATYTWGETEDYAINIIANVPVNPNINYTWNPGALSGNSVTVTPSATTAYTVTVTDPNTTCSSTASVNVTVNPIPPAPSTSGSEQCGSAVPTATVSSTSGATSPVFNWYTSETGGTSVQTGTSNTYNSLVTTTTTFYVSEISAAGCEGARAAVTVTVTEPDPITLTTNGSSVCMNSLATITASYSQDQNTYASYTIVASPEAGSGITGTTTMNFDNSTGGANYSFNPSAVGTYTYTVVATDPDKGCSASATATISVLVLPTIDSVKTNNSTVCAGSPAQLNAYSAITETGPQTAPEAYQTPTASGGSCIDSLVINTLSRQSACIGVSPNYEDVPASIATTTLLTGQSYTVSVKTSASAIASVWIDFDRSGTFDASEWVQPFTTGVRGSASILVPTTATLGVTKMRVRTRASGNTNGASDANTTFGSGETEDYTIEIKRFYNVNPALTYTWNPGALNGSQVTVNPTSTTAYTCTVTGANGCTASASVTVNALALPAAPIATNSTQCGTGVPTASVATGGANGTFNWYAAATGGSVLFTGSSITSTISTTTTYYVAEFDGQCESQRTAVTAEVTTPPAIDVTGSTTGGICFGANVNLTATSTASYTYTWSAAAGSGISGSVTGATQTITPTAAGTYVFTVNGTDGICTTSSTVSVTVNPNPVIDSAKATPTSVCAGANVTLNGYSSVLTAGPQTLPTGYAASNATSTADEEILNVTFGTINSTSTCTSTGGTGSIINQYSNYTTTVAPATVYTGEAVPFSVSVGTCGGNFSNKYAVFIDWNRNGQFDNDEQAYISSCVSGPQTTPVNSFITVPATAAPGRTLMRVVVTEFSVNCTTSPVTSTGTYTWGETEDYVINVIDLKKQNPAMTFTWNPGAINGANATTSLTSSTNYLLTVTNPATGCSTTATTPVSVTVVAPTVNLASSLNGASSCAGASVTLTSSVTGQGPFTYSWKANGSPIAGTTATLNVAPTATTTYEVTAKDACQNPVTASVTVNVNALPTVSIDQTGPISLCAPNTTTLSATASTVDARFQWTLNGSNISGATAQTYNAGSTGTYAVKVTDTITGCTSVASAGVAVSVTAQPSAFVFTPASPSIPYGGSVSITADGGTITTNNSMILTENFDGTSTWGVTDSAASPLVSSWISRTSPFFFSSGGVTFNNFSTIQGGKFMMANSDAGGSGSVTRTYLTSPSFSSQHYTSLRLDFEQVFRKATSGTGEANVEVSTNGGATWSLLKNYSGNQGTTTGSAQVSSASTINMSAYLNQPNLKVRFRYASNYGFYWLVDDIKIYGTRVDSSTIAWTPADGLSNTNTQVVTANPTTTSTYTVSATSAAGCVRTGSVTVTVRPTGSITGGDNFCLGGSATLSVSAVGNGPWSGTLSDGTTFSGSTSPISVTVTPSTTTTYTIAALTDASGSSISADLTGTATVVVRQPSLNVMTQSACDSYTFNGVTYTASGSYTFEGTNAVGCDSIAVLNLTITPSTTTTTNAVACGSYTWTVNGQTYTASGSYTSVSGCATSILNLTISCSITVDVKAYLQGLYTGNGSMSATLYDLGVSTDATATDTIEVNLWSAATTATATAPNYSAKAVLHTNGTASVTFPGSALGGSYYVALRHRNSLETWSASPITTSSTNSVDFSASATAAYGDGVNAPTVNMGSGVYALYGGDVNQDGGIDLLDMQSVDNDASAFAFGYNSSDCTGDGATDASDMQIIDNNASLFLFYARPF